MALFADFTHFTRKDCEKTGDFTQKDFEETGDFTQKDFEETVFVFYK